MLIGITKTLSDKLEDANYYILRTLLGLSKSTSYDSILKLINTSTLEQRRFSHVLILLFKCFNGIGPSYIADFFKLRTVNYNLRGSGSKLEQSSFHSKWRLNSFASIASHLWNTLPSNVRIAGNVTTFRDMIDKLNLVSFIYR